jgi:hypothetical protein
MCPYHNHGAPLTLTSVLDGTEWLGSQPCYLKPGVIAYKHLTEGWLVQGTAWTF